MTPAEKYANEYLKDYNLNDPASEADLWIIAKEAYQAGRDSKVKKLQAMRDDDFKLIQSLQKQLDEATQEYQKVYNNYAEHDYKLNEALQTIKELRLKL